MENLRWILIFSGVAILMVLYFTGRSKKATAPQRPAQRRAPSRGSSRVTRDSADPLLNGNDDDFLDDDYLNDALGDLDDLDMRNDPLDRPGGGGGRGDYHSPQRQSRSQQQYSEYEEEEELLHADTDNMGGIASKIEAFSQKLSPKRNARVAASESRQPDRERVNPPAAHTSKIVTMHVVAQEGHILDGDQLYMLFEERGYHYGHMNIFHSMHNGKILFSVAKIVVPGTFDINEISSFDTPGISLILQLPGPVPADVAFEVLLSEAADMAAALGAQVLDADRSTLSKQTIQHMREGIYEYMHKQKYFSGAPTT